MTPESRKLVQDSWMMVEPIADAAAGLFHTRLFALDPALRTLFRGEPAEQRRELGNTVSVLVRGLDRPDRLVPGLEALARPRAAQLWRDTHYEVVRAALLSTLEHWLGGAFTPRVRAAWLEAYALLTDGVRQAVSDERARQARVVARPVLAAAAA